MALDKFQPYLFVSAGEQSNKFLTPTYADGIAQFQAQRAQSLTGLTVRFDPIQEGTGEPSPTNIRPISGRTGMTVTHANKNLVPNMAGQESTTSNGITFTYNDDGSVTVNGTATGNAYSRAVAGIAGNIRRPYGTYKKPVASFGSNHSVGLFVQYQKSSSNWELVTGGGVASDTFTLDEDYPLAIRFAVTPGTTLNNYRFEPYIYPESISDTTWVSPFKTDIPITWESIAGTVYGGTLDVVSGVLTVDRAIYTGTWAKHPSYNTVFTTPEPSTYNYRLAQYTNCYCNCLPAQERGTTLASLNNTTQFRASDRLYVSVQNITTLADFNSWVEANELQLCYKLATPQTYQLTPTEIKTLAGYNQIYSDAGPVIDIKF